eukprot:COSAG06_NODE_3845_length_4841_cov_17.994095_2_plen_167_part_00
MIVVCLAYKRCCVFLTRCVCDCASLKLSLLHQDVSVRTNSSGSLLFVPSLSWQPPSSCLSRACLGKPPSSCLSRAWLGKPPPSTAGKLKTAVVLFFSQAGEKWRAGLHARWLYRAPIGEGINGLFGDLLMLVAERGNRLVALQSDPAAAAAATAAAATYILCPSDQ